MRLVVTLLLALLVAPFAAPLARAATAAQAEDHSCCPQAPPSEASTAPCQYLAPLACCQQTWLPASDGSTAPAAPLLALAVAPALEPFAPIPAPHATARRAEHGPPERPYLRAIVLQL